MKLKKNQIIAVFPILILIAVLIVFLCRAPVLIVTDLGFIPLYGEQRLRRESFYASLALFRPVRTVVIADDAGDDIVPYAVDEASSRPFCVLFPLRFARAAHLYREQNPKITAVLLEGRYSDGQRALSFAGGNTDDFFIYKTDFEEDLFRAGLAAALLDMEKNGRIAVFVESRAQALAREQFQWALNTADKSLETSFFTSFSNYPGISNLSCVVLAGTGAEYLETDSGVPVIFFTWLDPLLAPADVVLIIDDSPWAQAVQAVKMASLGTERGRIQSKFRIPDRKKIPPDILRKILKM